MNNDVYIWYSPATDITGKNIQDTLGISGGKTKPVNKKVVIGWGTKTEEVVDFPNGVKVINHPDAIKLNRNKLEASKKLAEALNTTAHTKIARLVVAESVKQDLADGKISMPLIGRKKYHQGGKGFWDCPTVAQLDNALKDGAQYFQEMLPVKDEYRLHVFGDVVIHAVKKVKRTDVEFESAWVEDELIRQRVLAEKNNNPFDEDIVQRVLKRQAKSACAGGANMVLRSNRLGWKFSIVKKYDSKLSELAIASVKAIGLTFGAVDCCLDVNDNPFVFEVNTGPGLESTSFEKYIEAFKEAIIPNKKATKSVKVADAAKVDTVTVVNAGGKKEMLAEQLRRLTDMVCEATEDEVDMVQKMGARIIFGTDD